MRDTHEPDAAEATTAADLMQQSHAILESVAEGTTDAVFVKDARGRYLLMNAAGCALVGKSRTEVVGFDDSAFFAPEHARWLMERDAAVMRSGVTQTAEESLTLVSGESRTFLVTKGPVRDDAGTVVGLFGISRDISERKRTERALRESEQKFRSVFDQSPIGKSITKLTGEVDFNPALRAMLGYTPDELRNVRYQALTHPGDVELSEREVAKLQTGEAELVRFRKRYLRNDGTVLWAELNISVRRDATGAPLDFLTTVVDITDRLRAEEALQESEARYRTLIEWSPVPMLLHRQGRILYANPAVVRLLRMPNAEALVGQSILDITAPDEAAYVRERTQAAVARGVGATTPTQEGHAVCGDGTRVTVEVQGVVVSYNGAPAMITVIRDVSEQRAREAALRESEYFFRESQRVANIGSYRADFVAGHWRSSEVLNRIFGIAEAPEHPISDWLALIHPDDQGRMAAYLEQEVIGRGVLFDNVYRIVRRNDGAVRWVRGLGELEHRDGAVVAMTGTILDITEQRAAQEKLRASEERLRTIVDNEPECVKLLDRDGRLLEMNPAGLMLVQATLEQVQGQRVQQLVAAEDRDAFDDMIDGVFRGETRHLVFDMIGLQGRRRTLETTSVPVTEGAATGGVTALLGVTRDITERKQAESDRAALEAQLQQAQKMESVGRLAGGVAHDFNNMLGVILGNVDLALEQVEAGDPLREDLDEVRRAAVRSVELTRQLLAFARKQTVAPQVLDLNTTVGGMLKMLQRLIGEDIALAWQPHAQIWPVKIDPSQVDQILANLCVNARDAITGTGRLRIETSHRSLAAIDLAAHPEVPAGDYVLLTVSDDGSGMSDETLSHLFEPFYTTKSMGKGTGLGLATVWGIVRQNNGFIEVASKPSIGTTFSVYLPRYAGKELSSGAAEAARAVPRGKETILLAEDEPGILALTARMLERQGYRVLRARTPGEAMRIAEEHAGDIHLLMTDVVMPEMNGRDLAKQLLALYPSLKRLFMSGYTADVIAHRGVLDSGVHFIQKPFGRDALIRKVRETLDADGDR